MPYSPSPFTLELRATADVRVGSVISVKDDQGRRFPAHIIDLQRDPDGLRAIVETVPDTWIRVGQTAYRLANPSERVVIVGVTEAVHCRQWTEGQWTEDGTTVHMGDRLAVSHTSFENDWYPYYHSHMTVPGTRFFSVQGQAVYEIIRQERDQFVVRDPLSGHDVILGRTDTAPTLWRNMGQRPTSTPVSVTGAVSFTRTQPLPASPPPPPSRFDRDDIV